jgi:hypothetical protein
VSLRIPLAVRLATADADRHVTRDLRSLSFRSDLHGFSSARLSLDRPLARDAPEVAVFGRCYVYDGRNGSTVWEGYQDDPGQGASADGQVWELTCTGPQARARDRTTPLVYAETQLTEWDQTGNEAARVSEVHDGNTDLYLRQHHVPRGTVAAGPGFVTDSVYRTISDAGLKLAAILFGWDGGKADGDWRMRVFCGGTMIYDSALNATGIANGWLSYSTHIPTGGGAGGGLNAWVVSARLARISTSQTVADDVTWGRWGTGGRPLTVRMLLYDVDGTERTTGYDNIPYVLASEVVKDLLGRLLPTWDGPGAQVDTTSYHIDQLSWPGATDAGDVLDRLTELEAAYNWQVWESPPLVAGGRSRFTWTTWPAHVRYDADASDGYSGGSQTADLYDSVQVVWTDQRGRTRTVRRTQTVPALADAGISREGRVELAQEMGSVSNAVQAGDNFLADHATPPSAGTLTVARPVLDRDAGRMVMPWEIRPGHLVRVGGLASRPDALLATASDGRSVFRVAAMEYDTASAAATLELDTWPRTVAQAIARLNKAKIKRGGRWAWH